MLPELSELKIPHAVTAQLSAYDTFLIGAYLVVFLLLAVYGFHRSTLVYLYYRYRSKRPEPLARLENLDVEAGVPSAKVVFNARTGSIVMNKAVVLDSCAVSHGNLTITINQDQQVSQPAPFSFGTTAVTDNPQISVKQDGNGFTMLRGGAKLPDVVRALNTLGATPQDLLAILQAMKSAGALHAEIEVI